VRKVLKHYEEQSVEEAIYSVRITKGYRALGLLEDGGITWFWIGSHADYDELISLL
jgi:hypothetical protein